MCSGLVLPVLADGRVPALPVPVPPRRSAQDQQGCGCYAWQTGIRRGVVCQVLEDRPVRKHGMHKAACRRSARDLRSKGHGGGWGDPRATLRCGRVGHYSRHPRGCSASAREPLPSTQLPDVLRGPAALVPPDALQQSIVLRRPEGVHAVVSFTVVPDSAMNLIAPRALFQFSWGFFYSGGYEGSRLEVPGIA